MKKFNLKICVSLAAACGLVASLTPPLTSCNIIQSNKSNNSPTPIAQENSLFGKYNNKDVCFNIESLCNLHDHNTNHPICGYYADSKVNFTIDRDKFNCPIYFNNLITSIPNDFLYNCASFNQKLDMAQSEITSIGDNFLHECYKFCSDVVLPSTCSTIGNNFLSFDKNVTLTSFNKRLDLNSVKTIGDKFLTNNNNFNSIVNINNVESIGKWFLAGCNSFGCPITIPSTCKTIGEGFMFNCFNFDSELSIESDNLKWEIGSDKTLTSSIKGQKMCTNQGFKINSHSDSRNTILNNFKNAFPFKNDDKNSLYRHYTIVSEPKILDISIYDQAKTTKYFVGQKFSNDGITLLVKFADNTTKVVSEGFTTSIENGHQFTSNEVGKQNVDVSYKGLTCSYTIDVLSADLKSIEINTMPNKVSFNVGEPFETKGLTLKAIYSDGSSNIITNNFTVSIKEGYIFTAKEIGKQNVIVSYENFTCSYIISISDAILKNLYINTMPNKTSFNVGDKFTTTGLSLTAVYSDESKKNITSGFTTSIEENHLFLANELGSHSIVISYKDFNCSYTINVFAPAIRGIEINTKSNKTSFNVGDKFEIAGLTLRATYSDGSKEIVTSGFTSNIQNGHQFVKNEIGKQNLIISYQGFTCSCDIDVFPAEIRNIEINNKPSKTSFKVGEKFDSTGLSLTAIYSDGSKETISSGFTTSIEEGHVFTAKEIGEQNVVVTYKGYICTYKIDVIECDVIKNIEINSKPTIFFTVDSRFNSNGLSILVKFLDGSSKILTSGFTTSIEEGHIFTEKEVGKQNVVVSYKGFSCTYEITVEKNILSYLKIKQLPNKVEYSLHETFSSKGLVLSYFNKEKGVWEDKTKGFVTTIKEGQDFFDIYEMGKKKKVTVLYKDLECTFYVQTKQRAEFSSFALDDLDRLTSSYENGSMSDEDFFSRFLVNGKEVTSFNDFIGAELPITLMFNGKNLKQKVRVIGTRHDQIMSGDRQIHHATFTFELTDLLSDEKGNAILSPWNDGNNHDYCNSSLQKLINSIEIVEGNKTINPRKIQKTIYVDSSKTKFNFYPRIFALTATEYNQDFDAFHQTDGTPYEYWVNHSEDDRIKTDKNGNQLNYWLASIRGNNQDSAWIVDDCGYFDYNNFDSNNGISFAFAI